MDARVAWEEFCELLKAAGSVLEREDLEPGAFDLGEGLRYLSRLTRAGLTSFVERADPRHPQLQPLPSTVGFGLDNPDNAYLGAGIDAELDYVIRGRLRPVAYLSFAAQNQNYAAPERITGGAGHLEGHQLATDADGRFEIVASRREHPGNWLRLAPDTSMILVRQTVADPAVETPLELGIACVGIDEPEPALDPVSVPNRLLGAAMFTLGASSWFADWIAPWRGAPNTLHFPDPEQHRLVGGDPNIVFQLGYWRLAPDAALVVETTPPRCDYWNFQLANIWTECLDRSRRIALNDRTATLEPDGSVRIVVARADPGHPNWLDTTGHAHGIMGLRWVRAETLPPAHCRVVPLADVRA